MRTENYNTYKYKTAHETIKEKLNEYLRDFYWNRTDLSYGEVDYFNRLTIEHFELEEDFNLNNEDDDRYDEKYLDWQTEQILEYQEEQVNEYIEEDIKDIIDNDSYIFIDDKEEEIIFYGKEKYDYLKSKVLYDILNKDIKINGKAIDNKQIKI